MQSVSIPITGKYLSPEGEVEASSITAPHIAFLFGGSWCPACKQTIGTMISERYNQMNDNGKNVEVIYVSADKDEAAFNDYYGEMPWLAIPFGDPR
jgi:nucleoredoxin